MSWVERRQSQEGGNTPDWFHPPLWRCVLRPSRTTLWLPRALATRMGVKPGEVLTDEQYSHHEVRGLLAERGRGVRDEAADLPGQVAATAPGTEGLL